MKRECLYFSAPKSVSIESEPIPPLGPDQVLVRTLLSAISPGTELLIYRGEFPPGLPIDESITALRENFSYPIKYGYSAVGQVIEIGPEVDSRWQDRKVFAFQPHTSHFLAAPPQLQALPEDTSLEDAVFLSNLETAVNLVLDGAPLFAEQVAVFGQGIVGLLTAALLVKYPLASLVTLDRFPLRRRASIELGAQESLDPAEPGIIETILDSLERSGPYRGADLVYELSGSPHALDQAVQLTGFSGRIVIGSWYGKKRADLDLGGRFHRARIRLISSQVSSIAPELTGRWTKERRFQASWDALAEIRPSRMITHRFPIHHAAQAYALLDQKPEDAIQVILTYR